MKKVMLAVKSRQIQGKRFRQKGISIVPAVLYGKGIKNQNVEVDFRSFNEILKEFGANALINLSVDDQERVLAIIQEIQHDPVTSKIIHCDFWKIDPKKEIKTEIEIIPMAEAPAVKELGGILIQNKNFIHIDSLPEDLISSVEVDISGLKNFDDKLHIKDLSISDKIKILEDPEEIIFTVQEPRSEEELAALEEKPEEDVELVEVGEKGKIEDEKAEETEAPAEKPAASDAKKAEPVKK